MDITSIISAFLPQGLLDHFDITDLKELGNLSTRQDSFYLYLDERNVLPHGYEHEPFESKGFFSATTVQDFPIRGKALYLVVRRRRWRLTSDHSVVIKGDYSFIAEGVKLTREVSDFLKGTGRDPRRYDQ